MSQTVQERNKALVLRPSIHYLTSGTMPQLSGIGRPTTSSTART